MMTRFVALWACLAAVVWSGSGSSVAETVGRPAPEEIAKAIEAEASARPEVLFGLVVKAFQLREARSAVVRNAILDDFALRLSLSKANVWLGPQASSRTGFVFVDFAQPHAFSFIAASERFAKAAGIRLVLLPSYMGQSERGFAYDVAGAVIGGGFPDLLAAGTAAGAAYQGDLRSLKRPDGSPFKFDGSESVEAQVDQVEPAHLTLLSFGRPSADFLLVDGRSYSGDLTDSAAMQAFYASPSR